MKLSRGRSQVAIPGPSIIPDRVLNAMHQAAPDIYGAELMSMTDGIYRDLRRVARTAGEVIVYLGNGHAAWEAALSNLLAPGDRALFVSTGRFTHGWAEMARGLGIAVDLLEFGFRSDVDAAVLTERLRADAAHGYRAVLLVQTDTASAVSNDIPAVRAALDAAGHPALLMVDCVASLGCERFDMDAWGVDVMVAAGQKGLMVPPGLAFTFHGPKADAARVPCRSPYWDWKPRLDPVVFYKRFCGTPPTHHLFGLRVALDMLLEEEGLEAAWARHRVFAETIWAAVEHWGQDGDLELNIEDRAKRSAAVTAIRTGPGDAKRLRAWCSDAGLTLGVGFVAPDADGDSMFRIGHMGHNSPPMILGALATIEAGLGALGIPHRPGGVVAAAAVIAAAQEADRGPPLSLI